MTKQFMETSIGIFCVIASIMLFIVASVLTNTIHQTVKITEIRTRENQVMYDNIAKTKSIVSEFGTVVLARILENDGGMVEQEVNSLINASIQNISQVDHKLAQIVEGSNKKYYQNREQQKHKVCEIQKYSIQSSYLFHNSLRLLNGNMSQVRSVRELFGKYFQDELKCPEGGQYSIDKNGQIKCSVHDLKTSG